ncbi:MAG TPA: DUF5995 family protein [Streptosporangiaceae bacterium]|nr:DUF5995 family protein [Streptosporangiaceae bacterium]
MADNAPGPAVPEGPVGTVAEAIARMKAIDAALPRTDGLACFNRMYLDVTEKVNAQLEQNFYDDPAFMTELDVTFANLYFEAAGAAANPADVPKAWRPLIKQRTDAGIEEIQFALAGMNAHINHDLPLAVVRTCQALATAPEADPHYADYTKVDQLLDAAEQAIREKFEDPTERAIDRHVAAVATLTCNWTMNVARDLAWNNSLLLWALRNEDYAQTLFLGSLATATEIAGRMLLVAV